MLKIDGSHGEGGGQIVRTALALSTITGKSFEITNIRKGRSKPGLKAQHLTCISALEQLCGASSGYVELGSEKLRYLPKEIKGKTINVDIGTAGSISLLLQSLLLPIFFANKKTILRIIGGTSGKWAMPYDFFNQVLVPQIRRYCKSIDVKLEKRGYYPKGGGKIEIKITPLEDKKNLPKFDSTEQGKLLQIKGVSHASSSLENAQVAERQAKSAKIILSKLNCPVQIRTEYGETSSPGSGIALWAVFSKTDETDYNYPIIIGSDALGEKGKKSEAVGQEAAEKLIKEINSKAPVDSHTADNLIPFLALAGGKIQVAEITEHTKSNIWICEQFLGKIFEIDESNNIIISKNS